MLPELLHALLLAAAFLCSLVAGFLLAFTAVVMPGLENLEDGDFIRAFQVVDRVIRNNQPLFVLMWAGSVVRLVAAAVLGVWLLSGASLVLVIVAAVIYLFCVQLPTITINIPLNNLLQTLNPGTMTMIARKDARANFESRWNWWNGFRTAFASVVSLLLMLLLLRL